MYAIEVKEVILRATRGTSSTETFVYEPATIDEEPLGNIYVIGWLNNRKAQFEFLPNLIASVIRREYYKPQDGSPELLFETALKKANAALEDIKKTNKNIAQDVNFAVINITQDKVRFCVLGDIVTLLSRNGDVVDMSASQTHKTTKGLFSSIVAGDIIPSDSLIFSTGRIMDIFSDIGIKKLFSLNLAEQAEIISKMYHKYNKDHVLPSQAAVLLKVKNISSVSRWLPFSSAPQSKSTSSPSESSDLTSRRNPRDRFVWARGALEKTKNIVRKAASKRGFLIIAVASAVTLSLVAGITTTVKSRRVESLSAQLSVLLQKQDSNIESTITQLKDIQNQALTAMSFWFTSDKAQEIFMNADDRIAHESGIHREQVNSVAPIDARSLNFTPSFIYSDDAFIYVFGTSPDSYLKIDKTLLTGSFSFLKLPENFETERMLMMNGDFYFINDAKKAAYVLLTEDNELVKVVRTLTKILATNTESGVRLVDKTAYRLEGGRIIKSNSNGKREVFLLNGIDDATDIAISPNGSILILTKKNVLAFPHQ